MCVYRVIEAKVMQNRQGDKQLDERVTRGIREECLYNWETGSCDWEGTASLSICDVL